MAACQYCSSLEVKPQGLSPTPRQSAAPRKRRSSQNQNPFAACGSRVNSIDIRNWFQPCASNLILTALVELPVSNISKMPGDGGRCSHHGADQVRASAAALASFEIAVAGGGATLRRAEDIRVHAQTHRAA